MTWELIEQIDLAAPASSIVLDEGLDGYAFYRLTVYVANDANSKSVFLRFNNDSGANYAQQYVLAASTTVSGARVTGQSQLALQGATLAASEEASLVALIAKPSATQPAQVVLQSGVNASPALALAGGEWDNVADLISRIDVLASSNNLAAGTSLMLEGLAA